MPRPYALYVRVRPWTDRAFDMTSLQGDPNGEALVLAALFASQGYIVVAPNYAGYDSSTLPYHPYLVADQQSKDMIDAFFDLITDSLVNGTDVKISGFGNFQIRTKAPRPGRNPRTGEPVAIEARRVVTFHASPKLKEQVQAAAVGT